MKFSSRKNFKRIPAVFIVIAIAVFVATRNNHGQKLVPPTYVAPLVEVKPDVILPGDPVFITINASSSPVSILWDKENLPIFTYEGKSRVLTAIDFSSKVTQHVVSVKLKSGQTLIQNVLITPREKIEKPLGIPEKLGGNTPAAATNLVNTLAAENKILNSVKSSPSPLWTKPFQYPLANVFITDTYGYDRDTVNQTIVHKGTDFRAAIGTEVHAMNKGIVRIARKFTAYGNAVVIDHGLGVQTLYMHMSRLDVKEGDTVEPGDLLGLSGDTGYVEAPHLHISVKINTISIDPAVFLSLFNK